jgi:uncharacterized membrane protein YdbT with pleckstrin-like domain
MNARNGRLWEDEIVLHQSGASIWYVLVTFAGLVIPWSIVARFVWSLPAADVGQRVGNMFFPGIWLVAMVPSAFRCMMIWLTAKVTVTNQRVALEWGLLKRTSIETYIDRVEGLDIQQSLLGRILGYGSVALRGVGGSSSACPGLAVRKVRRALDEARRKAS